MFLRNSAIVAVIILALTAVNRYKRGCLFIDNGATYDNLGSVFITGANTGIGLESARGLVRRGVHVILGCRSKVKCQAAKAGILKEIPNNGHKLGQVDTEEVNLSSLASIRACVERLKKYKQLRTLVNNAGIFDMSHAPVDTSTVEPHIAVNHLSHFYLTKLLLPVMKDSAKGKRVRVIIVSSNMHAYTKNGVNFDQPGFPPVYNQPSDYSVTEAYSQSKLANVLHAYELAHREKNNNVVVVSLHPGFVLTDIFRTFPYYVEQFMVHVAPYVIAKTSWEGAQTTLHCVMDTSVDEHSGSYFNNCAPEDISWPSNAGETDAQRRFYARRVWDLSEELLKHLE